MDRISNLPDELRAHIISFLPTKEAVSTRALSKKWENLRFKLRNLDFQFPSLFPVHDDSPFFDLDFLHGIIHLLSPEIETFRLHCRRRVCPGQIARWMFYAAYFKASEIDFDVHCMEFPPGFFMEGSRLTVLKLSSDVSSGLMVVPEKFCLPNLKSLTFWVSKPPYELTQRLFRSCPKLEDLAIGGTGYIGQVFDISCPSLRVLEIKLVGLLSYARPQVILNVPNIEHIHIEEQYGVEYVVQGPLVPIKASLSIRSCPETIDLEEYGQHAYALLKVISEARSLLLDRSTTYVLSKFSHYDVPAFQNLTCLEIGIARLCDWTFLFSVLDKSPNLLSLTMQKVHNHCGYSVSPSPDSGCFLGVPVTGFDWMEPNTPPTCLRSHLEIINISGFFWMCDMKAMKYLIGNARVLKEVTFRPRRIGVAGEMAFWMELADYAKASSSSSCVVRIKISCG